MSLKWTSSPPRRRPRRLRLQPAAAAAAEAAAAAAAAAATEAAAAGRAEAAATAAALTAAAFDDDEKWLPVKHHESQSDAFGKRGAKRKRCERVGGIFSSESVGDERAFAHRSFTHTRPAARAHEREGPGTMS